jgi:death-on-curing protein
LEKSAILIKDIISFHYFSDGNKRIGFIMLILFLKKNGYVLTATEDEKVDFALSIAKGELENINIVDWIGKHTISS